jgi:hypothetical protein
MGFLGAFLSFFPRFLLFSTAFSADLWAASYFLVSFFGTTIASTGAISKMK